MIEAVALAPFRVAVTVAVPLVVMVPAAAVKVAVVALAATATEAGTVRAALLDASETVVTAGLEFESVTVQVELVLEVRVEGEH